MDVRKSTQTSVSTGCDGACGCATPGVVGLAGQTDRRTFLAQGAAALAAMALAACGTVGSTPTGPTSVAQSSLNISNYPALANVGGVAVVRLSGVPVAIVRETTSSFSAFSLVCPHQGNTVQPNGAQGFYCPGHGALFNLQGQWIGGQPTRSLTSYPVQYNAAAGTLTVGS